MSSWDFDGLGYPVPKRSKYRAAERPSGPLFNPQIPRWGRWGTSLSLLERLPDEVLDMICTLLAPLYATRENIASFSLVSKRCARAASRRRLERIIITIGTTSKLRQDVNEIQNVLGRSQRLGCVRQVKLRDSPPSEIGHRSQLVRRDRRTVEDEDSEVDDEDNHNICRIPRFRTGASPPFQGDEINVFSSNPFQEEASPEEIREMSRRFWPLQELIARFLSLADLVWDCDYLIPMCLVDALNFHCPRARLHIHKFHLRTGCLPGQVRGQDEANADEHALITSPTLHTIVWRREGGRTHDKMNAALWCMLRGGAPNLKHVVLNRCGPREHSYRLSDIPGFEPTNHRAKLETLSVDAVHEMELLYWAKTVDFNELRTLRLRGSIDHRGARALESIIKNVGVERLLTLELHHSNDDAMVLLSLILRQVPPLEHLDFTGRIDPRQMPAIMNRHGQVLRILELKQSGRDRSHAELVQDLEAVIDIERECPLLERIDLTVSRTHGDARETSIYHALARMPHLRHVKLRLDCSMPTRDPRPGQLALTGGGGIKLSFFDYRAALTNTAIDHNLAVSKFTLFGPQLEYLRIKPRGHGGLGRRWYDEQAMELLDWVGRDWVVRGDGSTGRLRISRGGCVREGPNGGGPWRGESLLRTDFGREPSFDDERRDDLREIWTNIWPGHDGDRAEQWKSTTLANFDPDIFD